MGLAKNKKKLQAVRHQNKAIKERKNYILEALT
jgi:hypothetical protein